MTAPLDARRSLFVHSPHLAPPPSFMEPTGLSEVEQQMDRLVGAHDHAGRMTREHLAAGGKRLRARLALSAGQILGAAEVDRVAWAAPVELLHNATLVHDDIQDGDRTRRGQPTLWARHGEAQAINAGDLLLMLPYLAIAQTRHPAAAELCRITAAHAVRTVRGQIDEIDLLPSRSFGWLDYLSAIEGKTGALLALPVHGAALLAGRSPGDAEALCASFMPLGVLFQLQDDLLDLYGDKGRGQPGSDLYEGKVSAPVIAHLRRRPRDQTWLMELLQTPREHTSTADVNRARSAFMDSGAVDDVLDEIRSLAQRPERDPALRREPELAALAQALAWQATAPIRHLFAQPIGDVA